MSTKRPARQAYPMADGYVFVRGVDNVEDAREVAVADADILTGWLDDGNLDDVLSSLGLDAEADPTDAQLTEAGHAYAAHLIADRSGWWRFAPCPRESACREEDGHGYHINRADGPGAGRFRGVMLTTGGAA